MAVTYNVYFGLASGSLELVSAGQSDLNLQVPFALEYSTQYQWRVDSVESGETTTGDVWTFTTMAFAPPTPAGGGAAGSGLNNMVTIRRLVAVANNKVFFET